jgi:hypothetical protein
MDSPVLTPASRPLSLRRLVFWLMPMPQRFMAENAFFEHLGLAGGWLLVAWHALDPIGRTDGGR